MPTSWIVSLITASVVMGLTSGNDQNTTLVSSPSKTTAIIDCSFNHALCRFIRILANQDVEWTRANIFDTVTNPNVKIPPARPDRSNSWSEVEVVPATADPSNPATQLSAEEVPIFSCNFENDFCGFTPIADLGKEWHRMNIHDTEGIMAPTVPTRPDHLSSDRFLFAELTNKAINTVAAQLVSPRVPRLAQRADFCLKFSMFFEAPDMTKLKINIHRWPGNVQTLLREIISTPDVGWVNVETDFRFLLEFQISLRVEILPRTLQEADIAIDDLVLLSGKCRKAVEIVNTTVGKLCDFEENECGFINAGDTDSVSWVRTSRKKMPGGDLEILQLTPEVDATYHSIEGHYIFAHFGPKMDDAREEKSATYNSNPMNFNDTHCISFYYRMEFLRQKPTVKFYLKYLSDTLPPSTRYVATASHGKKWVSVKTEIPKKNGATISFEAIGPPKSRAGVAIDDIHIDQGSCSRAGDCNFNVNNRLCSWQHLHTIGSMRWLNRVAPIAAPNPPTPTYSISFEGGRSTGNEVNSRAVLYSEAYPMPQEEEEQLDTCMTFHYFMNASGAAVVRIHQVFDPEKENPIWESYGHASPNASATENTWRLAKVPLRQITSLETEYLITIEGLILRETDKNYIMAIDDVQFVASYCTILPPDANPSPRPSTSPRPVTSVTIPTQTIPLTGEPSTLASYNCNFGTKPKFYCDWSMKSNAASTITWATDDGEMHTDSGPAADVSGNGYYAYLQTRSPTGPTFGRMESPKIVFPASAGEQPSYYLVSFYYMMHGNGVDKLQFSARNDSEPTYLDRHELWSTRGAQGRIWKAANVAVPNPGIAIRVAFTGHRLQGNPRGYIAVDEITFEAVQVPDACDFEHGSCIWENFVDDLGPDDLDWEFGTSDILPVLINDTSQGTFMYVPIRAAVPPFHIGWLRQTSVHGGGHDYCLNFDFAITDLNVGQLSVYFYRLSSSTGWEFEKVWSTSGGMDVPIAKWQTGQVLLSSNNSWTVMFEAVAHPFGLAVPSDAFQLNGLALDNIRYTLVTAESECRLRPFQAAIPTLPPPATTQPTILITALPPTTQRPDVTSAQPATISSTATQGLDDPTCQPPVVVPTGDENPFSNDCNFNNNNFCAWSISCNSLINIPWSLAKSAVSSTAGPDFDVTGDGYFAYLDTRSLTGPTTGRMESPLVVFTMGAGEGPTNYLISFYYMMHGNGIDKLELSVRNESDSTFDDRHVMWKSIGAQGKIWKQAHVVIPNAQTAIRVAFTGHRIQGNSRGQIAVDEITFEAAEDEESDLTADCNFEDGWCSYDHVVPPKFAWRIAQTATGAKVARAARRSTSTQYFALRSDFIRPKFNACLRVKYHLNTTPTGRSSLSLWLTQQPNDGTSAPVRTLLWTVLKPNADVNFEEVHVQFSAATIFQISIEAVFKDGIRGGEDISVDDIRLTTTGECFAGAD
ncbi:MAM and LDL-receptor class A domain-containing protein 1 [Hypsibius exemplaris]|uniref:MAM and LDL-receptor class A domain-containing protein 1 n=1 Tax=Hypsibius exemplaris TaxID=2072580 RepID=A0A9X6RMW6_HYPEX|nr:MAM and LDL-receptor class A domain-containing protein 1 [Hypsibius exemplaris]